MTRVTQKSFNGGEISPSLYARNDLAKYSVSLKKLVNGFVKAEGCVSNRAGLEYVCEVKDSTKPVRLLPFSFNTEQTYIIEAGEHYFRYIMDGGQIIYHDGYGLVFEGKFTRSGALYVYSAGENTLYSSVEINTDVTLYSDEDLKNQYGIVTAVNKAIEKPTVTIKTADNQTQLYSGEFKTLQGWFSYDLYYLAGSAKVGEAAVSLKIYTKEEINVDVMCYEDKYFLKELEKVTKIELTYAPEQQIPTGGNVVIGRYEDKIAKRGLPVETEMPYTSEELFLIKYAQNADVLTLCNKNYTPMELSRYSHYEWKLSGIETKSDLDAPSGVSAKWSGASDGSRRNYSYVVTAVADENEESNRSAVATVNGHLESAWTTSEYITITWKEVEGAVEYNIYKSINGVFGYIGTAEGTSFTDNKIEPDFASCAPIEKLPFDKGNNPSCVNYYQQRKIFGCLRDEPQSIVTSQTGTDHNFNTSRPLNATDSINIKLSEREVNEIRHLIGLNDLIVLTSGAEWKLTPTDGVMSAASPPVCSPQSFYGCSHVMPAVSGNMILYVQAGGSVIRDLGYEYVSDSYNGDELTIFVNHLFENKQVVDMAYSKEPYRILWCVMSDGSVNALTYNKKQEVAGWSRHTTDGRFESAAVIREGFEDVVYFVVKRCINGETKRFIERMHTRIIENTSDGFFVDCGLKAEFQEEVTEIKGLEHLEGKTVSILADGGVYSAVVEGGAVTLQNPAKKVTIGLPYTFELETLNIEGENTHGLKKIITRVCAKVDKSREDFFIAGDDGTLSHNSRSMASVNDSEYLFSGNIFMYPISNYREDTTVRILQPNPLPLTITSLSADILMEDVQ